MASASLIVFALLALFATALAGSCTVSGCNGFNGKCYATPLSTDTTGSYCSCRSGYSGSDCATQVQSCSFNQLNTTATNYPPVKVASFFASNTLTVQITSPLVDKRNYTIVAIDDSAFQKDTCTYPGQYWSRSFADCNDYFLGEIPWSTNVGCGWVVNNTDTAFTEYTAQMIIQHHDVADPFSTRNSSDPVERIVEHRVPLSVKFPKNIELSSNFVIQSPVKVIMAISKQSLAATGETATIEMTTNVIWPYRLTTFTIDSTPGTALGQSYSVDAAPISEDCPNDGTGASCTQTWRLTITNGEDCQLNGDFKFNYTITCQQVGGSNPAACAIQAGDQAFTSLSVFSEEFCASVSTSTPISGDLKSYFANTRLSAENKTNFLIGQTLFWRATVVSDNITLTNTSIDSVRVTEGAKTWVLYAANAISSDGTTASFQETAFTATTADFQFTLTDMFLNSIPLPDDAARPYVIVAIVEVDYQDSNTGKRSTQLVEFTSALSQSPVAIASNFIAQGALGDSASSLSPIMALFAAVLLAVVKLF